MVKNNIKKYRFGQLGWKGKRDKLLFTLEKWQPIANTIDTQVTSPTFSYNLEKSPDDEPV